VLVAVGLLTGVVGAVMALAQRHLKRLLAFATISYIGLFTIGLAMLTPSGLAGTAAYVVGDGLVKASLFVAVGIAQYRLAGVEESRLHGHGQRLWFPAAIFALGGLAVAGLPPFGPFLGHSLIEDAAATQPGYGWVPAAMAVISALAGAAVLRTGARVFLELGPPPKPAKSGRKADEESEVETEQPHATTPALLALPAAALLAAGLAWGVLPGLTQSLIAAASHFTDHFGYQRVVLSGMPSTPAVLSTSGPTIDSYLYGVGATIAAVALAAIALYVDRLPRPAACVLDGLRALHSGRIGDYVAWLSIGVATIGGAFALTLR
jgi:multicomponent Na+:H+ antiporter subunit D